MNSIIGRIQTEADPDGKRMDIQLDTTIHGVKMESGGDAAEVLKEGRLGITFSKTKPRYSSVWITDYTP